MNTARLSNKDPILLSSTKHMNRNEFIFPNNGAKTVTRNTPGNLSTRQLSLFTEGAQTAPPTIITENTKYINANLHRPPGKLFTMYFSIPPIKYKDKWVKICLGNYL